MIKKEFAFEIKDVDIENYTMRAIVSSGATRQGWRYNRAKLAT